MPRPLGPCYQVYLLLSEHPLHRLNRKAKRTDEANNRLVLLRHQQNIQVVNEKIFGLVHDKKCLLLKWNYHFQKISENFQLSHFPPIFLSIFQTCRHSKFMFNHHWEEIISIWTKPQ